MIQHRGYQRASGPRQALAFTATVIGHVALGAALWFWANPIARPKPPDIFYISVDPLRPKPPPEPVKPEVKPPETPQVAEAPKPVERPRRPTPVPVPHAAAPPADSGPPVHYFGQGVGAGSGAVASGLGAGNSGAGHHPVSDYADRVKARILANRVVPPAVQKRRLECVVTYSVTIDRTGRMIAHQIDPCPYAELNAAAEATLVKSAPFDPPDPGTQQKVIFGSLPVHSEVLLPPAQAER